MFFFFILAYMGSYESEKFKNASATPPHSNDVFCNQTFQNIPCDSPHKSYFLAYEIYLKNKNDCNFC